MPHAISLSPKQNTPRATWKQSAGVIFDIWYGTVQLWIYACIQRLMFLQPRITGHSFYPKALGALKSSSELHILVRPAKQSIQLLESWALMIS